MTADMQTIFSTSQAVAGTDTTVLSTDWIPLGVAQNMGDGIDAPGVEIHVITAPTAGTSITFQLLSVATDGTSSPVVLDQTRPYLIAELLPVETTGTGASNKDGTIIGLRMSPQVAHPVGTCLRVRYSLTGGITGFVVSAQLVPTPTSQRPQKAHVGT